ncbi:hypothetical protein GCM10023219_05040 [Stakelama sediminis]|uniref:Phytanoyl-CoA dioxygenase n=1 Tax=Stakelama sediminis TaxID=463200 RepID=A0A840YUA2_9SPHN|nr:phytanoyl-CoA dioxygenase family protein [Stakelama sediminis]MBB5717221.1 hypothetical protein [Stakelama sediminis]
MQTFDAETAGPKALNFSEHGAQRFPGAVKHELEDILSAVAPVISDRPGVRVHAIEPLRPYLNAGGSIGSLAASVVGPDACAVRAIWFDKAPGLNWSLAWHQDRTICVKERIEISGFGPWTVKQGMLHVAPPFSVLKRMVTLRIHFDDVGEDNAPLLIAPGSQRAGLIPVTAMDAVVREYGEFACLAHAGDVWIYATPIVHASRASDICGHRRVLQVDYAAEALPGGLEWLGV